jgi:hypothetical protein
VIRVTKRTARKWYSCPSCGHSILPGDKYLEQVVSPWHDDLGNDRWWRIPECLLCATRYGRIAS